MRVSFLRIVLLSALAAAASACGQQSDAARAQAPPPPPEVLVAVAERGDALITHEASGRVVAYRTAEVRARVEGILEERLYREGGEVEAGQVLFRIDRRTLEAEVAAAKAALAKARANAEIALQTAQRYRQLIGDQAISKQELDQAEAQAKQAQAEVLAAEAALERATIDLGHATVRAPISGRITRAFVTEGALVGRGEATHLATIEQLDPIYVDFTQSGSELLRLRRAMLTGTMRSASRPIELLLEDGSRYAHPGELLFAEQTVDRATGTVTLRAEFPNPDRLLLPGMFATVRFSIAALDDAVRVPQRAVQATPQGQFVYVIDADNEVVRQPVTTGGFSGPDWIITEGLQGGERVVIEGLQKIRPGMVVKPTLAQAPAAGRARAAAGGRG
jgi:membrane fusion protein (multidrug efflux system)